MNVYVVIIMRLNEDYNDLMIVSLQWCAVINLTYNVMMISLSYVVIIIIIIIIIIIFNVQCDDNVNLGHYYYYFLNLTE